MLLSCAEIGLGHVSRIIPLGKRLEDNGHELHFFSGGKAYELLTVEAAIHGDRNAAYQALLAHPLGPKVDKAQAVLEDMLETNKSFLPQFFGK